MFLRESNRSTALKTLALRLRGAKTELEEAGEDVDGMAESTSQLQAKLKALTHGRVDIMLDADTFKSTTQILREMSEAWEYMTDIERAAALELMGGKRQANILSSVITNFETVEEVIETSMNSSGSAMAENEKWLDSIEGKTYQFTNALQKMWSNLIDSEMVKTFVDFGTDVVNFLDTGAGKAVAFAAAVKLLTKFKGLSIGGIFKGLGQSLQQINTSTAALNVLPTASIANAANITSNINAYASAVNGLTPKLQAQMLASKGLNAEQIRLAMSTNGVDQANIRLALSNTRVSAATKQSAAITGENALAMLAAQEVTISQNAQDWLAAQAKNEVTIATIKQAVATGTLTAQEGAQLISTLALTTANRGLAGSFTAIGTSMKMMMMSNPIGFFLTIATTIFSVISIFDLFGKETKRTMDEIEQSLQSAVSECKNIVNEFKDLKESTDDIIPRFAELSEGVDNFGRNISLTDSEYEEFLGLNNKIADMFPELNMGFDSNGNAMLALAGSASELTARLNELVEAERQAANKEIADKMPDLLKDLKAYTKGVKKEVKHVNELIDILRGDGEIVYEYGNGKEYSITEKELKSMLDAFGIDYTTKKQDYTDIGRYDKTITFDPNSPKVQAAIAAYEHQIYDLNQRIANKWKSLNPIVSAWMETDWDFTQLDSEMQDIAVTWISNLDFSKLGLKTEKEVQDYIRKNVLKPLGEAGPEVQDAFSRLLNIGTKGKTAKEYLAEVRETAQEIADLSNGAFTYEDVLKNTGYDDIIAGYNMTAQNIVDILAANAQSPTSYVPPWMQYQFREKVFSLSPEDVYRAFDIVKKYGITTWDELVEALEKRTFDVVLDYNVEKESIDKFLSAVDESVSATGLSDEAIANIKARYQDLEGYDPARLFEETANGIHLNSQALRELEQEYKGLNKEALDNKLEGLVETYNDLTLKIENCTDASKRAQLYAQRQNVLDQINDTATLASKYTGLTSAYNEWKQAQSGGNQRNMYEGIIEGREEIEEELSRGWVDDGTREYLELLSGKDLSTASYEELLAIYKELGKAVNSSGYNVFDFFTTDKDGNATTEGVYNFFDAVRKEQEKIGAEWVTITEDGKYSFDFASAIFEEDGITYYGDAAIAKMLGISEELVQIILRASEDAGFTVNFDSAYSDLADFRDQVETTNQRLKELGVTEYAFNINSTNVDDLDTQIDEAQQALDGLYDEDGNLRVDIDVNTEDVENAKLLLATLIYQRQTLDKSAILSIDTSQAEGAVETVKKLQDYKALYNEYEVKVALGEDTTELETQMKNLLASFTEEDKRILIGMGLDLTSSDTIKDQIDELNEDDQNTLIELGIDIDADGETIISQINALVPEDKAKIVGLGVDINASPEEVIAQINAIMPEYFVGVGVDPTLVTNYMETEHSTTGEVVWSNNIDAVTDWVNNHPEDRQATGTITWYNKTTELTWPGGNGGTDVDGTANVDGTAYAGGSWGAPKTETALMGELGPEILVRNGRWTTVGENGAEFAQVKKGDIIFNHKQTESLLKNGRITGRGKAYAGGTAYAFVRESGAAGRYTPTKTSQQAYDDAKQEHIQTKQVVVEAQTVVDAGSSGGGPSREDSNDAKNSSGSSGGANTSGGSGGSSSSGAKDEFEEVFDWIEVRLEEISDDISLRSAELENKIGHKAQNNTVDKIIDLNQKLYDNLVAGSNKYYAYANKLLSKVPAEYRKAAQDGTIAIEEFVGEADEKTLEAIKEYREWVQKGDEAAQQAEETLTEISNLAKQEIDNIASDYGNKASLRENQTDQLNAYNALAETMYGFESEKIYEQLIGIDQQNVKALQEQKNLMQKELNAQVEAGNIKKYSQDWYDAVNDIAAVDTEIIELTADINDYQDKINELHWDKFDALIGRLESISNEAENLIDVLGNKDMVDEMGNWTTEGITTLGLYAQQMEVAEVQAKKYQDEIAYLNKNWKALGYTEEEYIGKLEDLKDGQYDAIKAYHDSKDAIVDLNKERIDVIKDGIEKEIEAYEKLIDKKKEELDAEKDLYDFQKSVMEKEKDIADLKRQLAALSADNSASARAKRAQLEAEIAEAQADLEDQYYNRSVSNQQEALDKELENYNDVKDSEMEALDEYLKNTEQVVADSLATIQANTDAVYQTLNAIGQEYSLSITESLTSPWKEGELAIQSFSERFGLSMSATVEELNQLELEFEQTISAIDKLGSEASSAVENNTNQYTSAEYKEPPKTETPSNSSASIPSTAGMVSSISGTIYYGQTGSRVKSLQTALNALGYNCGNVDGKFGPKTLAAVKQFQKAMGISQDGRVGPKTKEKFKLKGYAVGSMGVSDDQWAILDELGEELELVPGQNGRLAYIKKGTGILTADMTERLMDMAMNPQMMLDQNRPAIGLHPEIHNNQIVIDNSVGELIHIDKCDQSTLPDVEKIVNKAVDNRIQSLNQSLRKFVR